MSEEIASVRKVTVSLPESLVEFADQEAARLELSRSALIARVLAESKAKYEADLAAEGYRLYAQEASEFAEASARAVAEAWGDGS
jgi:metal-responsive CopG/Arc/MetJ family transcriptional regulator